MPAWWLALVMDAAPVYLVAGLAASFVLYIVRRTPGAAFLYPWAVIYMEVVFMWLTLSFLFSAWQDARRGGRARHPHN